MAKERLIIQYKNGAIEERIIYPFHRSRTFKELGYCQKGMATTVAYITITRA